MTRDRRVIRDVAQAGTPSRRRCDAVRFCVQKAGLHCLLSDRRRQSTSCWHSSEDSSEHLTMLQQCPKRVRLVTDASRRIRRGYDARPVPACAKSQQPCVLSQSTDIQSRCCRLSHATPRGAYLTRRPSKHRCCHLSQPARQPCHLCHSRHPRAVR